MKRKEGAFWAVQVLIVIGVLALVALPPGSISQQASFSSVSTQSGHFVVIPSSYASSLDPSTDLRLDLNLSTNTSGQLVVTIDELNTLDHVNNVSYGDSWPNASLFQWTHTNCEGGGMEGYEILQGNYQGNNYTQGKALWLQPQIQGIQCGGGGGIAGVPENSTYNFRPLSAEGMLSGTYVGFWTNPRDSSAYQPFAAGAYTVLAGDQWGQVAILHFIVTG
jgi:hypothetical protein